jgi:hypothetical protein
MLLDADVELENFGHSLQGSSTVESLKDNDDTSVDFGEFLDSIFLNPTGKDHPEKSLKESWLKDEEDASVDDEDFLEFINAFVMPGIDLKIQKVSREPVKVENPILPPIEQQPETTTTTRKRKQPHGL